MSVAGVLCLLASTPVLGGDEEPLRAQQVIGREVVESGGRETGWVEDLLVDVGARRVAALIVAHDGRSVRVPATGARYQDGQVRLAQDERALDRLPRWDGKPVASLARAKATLGKPLRSRDGLRAIGTVEDFLIDLPGARITHVVLDLDEGRKAGAGWIAVPAQSVSHDAGGLRAAFDPAHLYAPGEARRAAAPVAPRVVAADVRLSAIAGKQVKAADGTVLGKVSAVHLDRSVSRIAALRVEASGGSYDCAVRAGSLVLRRAAVEALTGGDSGIEGLETCRPASRSGHAPRGRDLIGARILDSRGRVAGAIREVAVDAETGQLHYLIGSFGPDWVAPGHVVALPLRPVEQDGEALAVRAQLTELMHYPVFAEARIADLWSPAFARGMDQYLVGKR